MNLKWLKPNWLTIIFLLVLAFLVAVIFAASSTSLTLSNDNKSEVIRAFGIGACIESKTVYSNNKVIETDTKIHWHWLLLNILLIYSIAALMSLTVKNKLNPQKPAILFSIVILVTVGVSIIAGVLSSKLYWGYFFSRPAIDRRVKDFKEILTVTRIASEKASDKGIYFVIPTNASSIAEEIEYGRNDPYYCLSERILIELQDNKILPDNPPQMPKEQVDDLYSILSGTGLIIAGTKGYTNATSLFGIVVEAKDNTGKKYLFFGGNGRQVSNDHCPYYEFLFEMPDNSKQPNLISFNQFYYDVAGIEGFEWYFAAVFYICIGLPVSILCTCLFLFIRQRYQITKLRETP